MSRLVRSLLSSSVAAVVAVVAIVAIVMMGGSATPAAATVGHVGAAPAASATVAPSEGDTGTGTREVQLDAVVTEPASSLVVFVVAGAVIAGAAFMGRRGRR